MVYNIPKKLKEENKIFEGIFIRDLVTIGICLSVFWLFSNFISNDLLRYIYWVCALVACFYLSRSAKNSNPGLPRKQRWEAIQMMIMKDPATYYSLNIIREEDLIDDTGDEEGNESKETK